MTGLIARAIAAPRQVLETAYGYWGPTDRHVDHSTYLDELAARAVNLANAARDAEPFGSLPAEER
ncbi:MAG: hypothetical protein ACXV2H_07125 [Actinomycetes bacterium]